ncbi:MAG: LysR family transcriptional regulator [Alphaproteobacteria bacterium]|nr:LysR family transcriptional regulator [Alphaproteobacteria bacterium]
METELARTFLEIVATGSFLRAAEKLHISQTAVSARIRSLEQQLGRQLIVRNKAGATLTPAGEKFLRYAPSLVQLWERASHDVSVPPGHRAVLAMGAELTLWRPVLLNWLLWMRKEAPDIALRTVVGIQESLNRQVAEGVLDLAIMYAPQHLPGLIIEQLVDEELVLVSTDRDTPRGTHDGYVYVDWGPDFSVQHGVSFPDHASSSVLVGLGPLGLEYILAAGGSGYFRRSAAQPYLASGQLHIVKGAPIFPYPAYAVYATRSDPKLVGIGLKGLRTVSALPSDSEVLAAADI